MKKIAVVGLCLLTFSCVKAQDSLSVLPPTTADRPPVRSVNLPSRSGDHLMIQFSSDHWAGAPDSISNHQGGFSRGFNAYFMLDKPFRNSPKLSIGLGLGIGTSNIFFKRMELNLKAGGDVLPFTALDSLNHFKKYKLSTGYVEVPLEFRYTADPYNPNKSFKFAIGGKFGTIVNAHTKGKTLQDKNNNSVNSYTLKENTRRLINGTRFMGTARIGYGIISLFGSYQLNGILKDGAGADMKLYQVGLTLSGL